MFDRILARNPNDISILRALGELLALCAGNTSGRWKSIGGSWLWPPATARPGTIWPAGWRCKARPERAVKELGRAMQFGYEDFEHLEFDSDLDNLRDLPAYHALLREYGIPDSASPDSE